MDSYWLIVQTFSPTLRRMLAAQGLVGLGAGMFAVLLNLYLRGAGYHEQTIGRFLAVQSVAAALASMPMGWLADRTSRRTTYLVGLAFLVTGYALVVFSYASTIVLLACMINGIGNGAMMVTIQPFLQENSRRRQRPFLFSLNFSMGLVMSIFAGLLAGWLPRLFHFLQLVPEHNETEALRFTLGVGVGFLVLAVWPALRLPRGVLGTPRLPVSDGKTSDNCVSGGGMSRPAQQGQSVSEPAPFSLMARFVITSGLIGLGAGLIVPYFNLYFRDWVGASVEQIGMVFASGQLATAIGGFLSPWLSRSLGLMGGVVLTQGLSLPFMAIMAWRHEFWVCGAAYFFRGAFMNMAIPIRQGMLMERIPAAWRARASALDSAAWNLCWAVSMFFSGGWIKNHGYDFCLGITFGCYALACTLFYLFFRDRPDSRKDLAKGA